MANAYRMYWGLQLVACESFQSLTDHEQKLSSGMVANVEFLLYWYLVLLCHKLVLLQCDDDAYLPCCG